MKDVGLEFIKPKRSGINVTFYLPADLLTQIEEIEKRIPNKKVRSKIIQACLRRSLAHIKTRVDETFFNGNPPDSPLRQRSIPEAP